MNRYMETTYHIGHEIEKELRAQGKSARWLADEICLTPQAVYDIFKRNHIATDRLADIQRVLGRDFFKELSQLTNNGDVLADEEDESVLQERFELLMPEDKLHVLKREAYEELIEEFVVTEHHKPLVIFTNDPYIKGSVERTADRELGIGQVFYLDLKREWGKTYQMKTSSAKSRICLIPLCLWDAMHVITRSVSWSSWLRKPARRFLPTAWKIII